MRPALQTTVLALGVTLLVLSTGYAAEPAERPLAEKEIKKILAQNDKLLDRAQRAHRRQQMGEFEKFVSTYTQSVNRLSQALAEDRFAAAKPEKLLWRVDKSALKQCTLLEKLFRQSPEDVRRTLERAIAAARGVSRVALNAITRLHDKEFRLNRGRSGSFHQERKEEIYVPGTPSPRPRPRPEPPP